MSTSERGPKIAAGSESLNGLARAIAMKSVASTLAADRGHDPACGTRVGRTPR